MSDEKITPSAREAMKEAVLAEVLGDVGEIKEQVKAIHAGFVETNNQLKKERNLALEELRGTGTAERDKLAAKATKLVHDGINSEIDGIKSSLNDLILKTKQASDEIRFQMFRAILLYGLSVGIGVVFVSYIVIRTALNH